MYQKIGLKMAVNYSPNFNLPKRLKKRIKFIIIHYTGMKKDFDAIQRLQDPKSKVSSHYLIRNNGDIVNLVPDLYEAWHAGVSSWKNFKSLNKNSSITLIGMPGTGKTVVSDYISSKYNYNLVDICLAIF